MTDEQTDCDWRWKVKVWKSKSTMKMCVKCNRRHSWKNGECCLPRVVSTFQLHITWVANSPVTSLGDHEWQNVFWEGPKFFKLCPIVFNYARNNFSGRRKILQGGLLVANKSETKIHILYYRKEPHHTHGHTRTKPLLDLLVSSIYLKYLTAPWQWQNFTSHLLLCVLFRGTSGLVIT